MMDSDPFRTQRDVGAAVVTELSAAGFDDAEEIGRGGFGIVCRCTQLGLDRTVASAGVRGRLQRLADATVWPRLFGNCHTHRDTERAIAHAGFRPQAARHDLEFPAWVPMPVSEVVIGRAVKPS
jgi:hypothetical protein